MFVFAAADFYNNGKVTHEAVAREAALIKPHFPVTPELIEQLYALAQYLPVEPHVENLPEGKYLELQVGRSIEHKMGFRFIS